MNEANVSAEIRFDQDAQLSEKPSGVFCPACRNELLIGTLKECQFAGCKHCGGMMFQQDTFASLIAHLRSVSPSLAKMPAPMDAKQLGVRRQCPTCGDTFETHPYAGPGNSVIDTCFDCRVVWFDHGELDNLVSAPGRR